MRHIPIAPYYKNTQRNTAIDKDLEALEYVRSKYPQLSLWTDDMIEEMGDDYARDVLYMSAFQIGAIEDSILDYATFLSLFGCGPEHIHSGGCEIDDELIGLHDAFQNGLSLLKWESIAVERMFGTK